jgi:hypothetical protein
MICLLVRREDIIAQSGIPGGKVILWVHAGRRGRRLLDTRSVDLWST